MAAVAACAALGLYIRGLVGQAAVGEIREQLDEAGRLRPLAEVIELTRSLKLITVEVASTVPSAAAFSNWRGTVHAEVIVPVRYGYGVDLARLDRGAFLREAVSRTYIVRLPRPERLYVEVDTSSPVREEVKVSFLQFRRTGGEYFLGEARKQLSREAWRQALPPDVLRQVENETLERVRKAIRPLLGDTAVRVEYQ